MLARAFPSATLTTRSVAPAASTCVRGHLQRHHLRAQVVSLSTALRARCGANRPFRTACNCVSGVAAASSPIIPSPVAPASVELKLGYVYDATVTAVFKGKVLLDVQGRKTDLPIRNVSRERLEDIGTVFSVGEQIKVLVSGLKPTGAYVSTKLLEPETDAGLMLRDKQAVWAGADKQAEVFRAAGAAKSAERQRILSKMQVGDIVEAKLTSIAKSKVIFSMEGQLLTARPSKLKSLYPLNIGETYKLHVLSKLESGYPILGVPKPPRAPAPETPSTEQAPAA